MSRKVRCSLRDFNLPKMAQRRMFSLDIVASDAFLEMPTSSRELYFHLGMYADDDGFVTPKKIMRLVSASDDDLKVLIAKRFLLPFETGVVVVKHWKINNYLQKDRYKPTRYLDERKRLQIKDNGSYTENIQNVSNLETQSSIGKDRIDKNSILEESSLNEKINTEKFKPEFLKRP